MAKRNKTFILIENIKEPISIDLKSFINKDGYLVSNGKQIFKSKEEIKLYKKLIKRGLFKKRNKDNQTGSNIFLIHRLISCLYENAFGHEIHHIDKNRKNNNIKNLIKVKKKKHDEIHKMSNEDGIKESQRLQDKLKDILFREPRNTLTQRAETILDILQKKNKGLSVKEIKNKRCKKSSVYNILKYFYHSKLFTEWVKKRIEKVPIELNGKFKNNWKYILEFEKKIQE